DVSTAWDGWATCRWVEPPQLGLRTGVRAHGTEQSLRAASPAAVAAPRGPPFEGRLEHEPVGAVAAAGLRTGRDGRARGAAGRRGYCLRRRVRRALHPGIPQPVCADRKSGV